MILRLFLKILIALIQICMFNSEKISEKPLLLLVSFDGFRWDYLSKHNLSNFTYLKSIGSYSDFIYNSFATVTFPNHWTLVTGRNFVFFRTITKIKCLKIFLKTRPLRRDAWYYAKRNVRSNTKQIF